MFRKNKKNTFRVKSIAIAIFSFFVISIYSPCSAQTAPTGWEGKRVLHIGDSMLKNWGLRGTLQKKFRAAGAKYFSQAESGYNSRAWVVTGKLRKALKTRRPDIVLINLGTNAVKVKHPENYAVWIKKLVNKIKPRKCYWISPPGLIEDRHGFYDILAKSIAPCKLLDSRQAHFQRPGPKVFHLTRTQSIKWADMIWEWVNRQPELNDTDTDVKLNDTDTDVELNDTENIDKTPYGF